MMPGDAHTKDSAQHMISQAAKSSAIDRAVCIAFKAREVKAKMIFIVTRQLSGPVQKLLEKNGTLWNREYLYKHIWTKPVCDYADECKIDWIKKLK